MQSNIQLIKTMRRLYNGVMDIFAVVKVYFYKGWSYVSLAMGIFSLMTFLIVSDYKKYLPDGLPFNAPVMAVIIMLVLMVGSVIVGKLDFDVGTAKRENDINLKLSPNLNGNLVQLNKKFDRLIELLEDDKR